MFIGVVVIFSVWMVQLKYVFSDAVSGAEDSLAQTKEQIDAGVDLKDSVADYAPVLDQGLDEFLEATTGALIQSAQDRAAQAAADQIGEAVADAVADGLIGDVEEDSRTLPVSEYEEVEGVDEPADQE